MAMPDRRELIPGFLRREREQPEPPENRFYNQAASIQRAWYVIQGESRNVIDFDLIGGNPTEIYLFELLKNEPFKYQMTMIIKWLDEALEESRKIDYRSVQDSELFDFSQGHVSAMSLFARRVRGDNMDKAEYIEHTMQVPLVEASPEIINYQLGRIYEIAASPEVNADLSEAGFEKWRIDHRQDEEAARRQLVIAGQNLHRAKAVFVGEKERTLPVNIASVYEDAYFYAWSDTDKKTGGFKIKQNFGTKERPKIWTPGKAEELGPHEYTQHIGRMQKRKDQIASGKLHPFFGQTTTHGPEQTVEEGLAMTVTSFVPGAYERLSPEGKLQVHMTLLKYMELGNAQLRLLKEPDSNVDDMAAEVKEILTWEPIGEIKTWLQERVDHPLLETYMRGYAEGARRHIIYSMILSDRGKQAFLKQIDQKPYNANQEARLINEIAVRDRRNIQENIPEWVIHEYQEMLVSTQTSRA